MFPEAAVHTETEVRAPSRPVAARPCTTRPRGPSRFWWNCPQAPLDSALGGQAPYRGLPDPDTPDPPRGLAQPCPITAHTPRLQSRVHSRLLSRPFSHTPNRHFEPILNPKVGANAPNSITSLANSDPSLQVLKVSNISPAKLEVSVCITISC